MSTELSAAGIAPLFSNSIPWSTSNERSVVELGPSSLRPWRVCHRGAQLGSPDSTNTLDKQKRDPDNMTNLKDQAKTGMKTAEVGMHGAAKKLHEVAEDRKKVLKTAAGDAKSVATKAADKLKSATQAARDQAGHSKHELGDALKHASHDVGDAVKHATHDVGDAVKRGTHVAKDAFRDAKHK